MFTGFKINTSGIDDKNLNVIKQIGQQSLEIKKDSDFNNTVMSNKLNVLQTNLQSSITTVQTNLDTVQGTQYVGGQTYNGVTLSVTATSGTLYRGVFIPYQTFDGAWRLKCNLVMTYSPAVGNHAITIAGVVFKNLASYYQSVDCFTDVGASYFSGARTTPNTGQIYLFSGAGGITLVTLSFDVELDSKPTWAN